MGGLLVLLAHPDDEFFCAGLISALVRKGIPVHLVCWTGGEGGMPRRQRFWLLLPHWWRPRVREMRQSARSLGVTSLTFLGYADPPPRQGLAAPDLDPPKLKREISGVIARHQPEMIVTHGSDGDYGHPAHLALYALTRDLAAEANARGEPFAFMTFNATYPGAPKVRFLNRSDSSDCLFDSRPSIRKKIEVFRCHRSQALALRGMIRKSGASLTELLRKTRHEGYRCWNEGRLRETARAQFRQWTEIGEPAPFRGTRSRGP